MGRHLGQHFLNDKAILDRIVAALDPTPDDVVIEIGPGKGSLTRRLAPRVRAVVALELDRLLAADLREKGKGKREGGIPDNVRIVDGDALELDWGRVVSEQTFPFSLFPFPAFKVVGNIPYQITSPLIEKALTPPLPAVIVMLMQKEVADRLVAQPGSREYSGLTVGVRSVAAVERLFIVRAGAFNPPPKVDSAVVRFRPLADPLIAEAERAPFRAFVSGLFSRRRKQLGRSLRDVGGLSKEQAAALLAQAGIAQSARPETVAPAGLVALFRLQQASHTL
ncbi:MAG: ribosomal RNA small subunit methyltransferase A [Gemmatimonadetes bacterium]|nr:ribosomal RNA small subunit methyltransferase A [Gemmatimonadota bacterium]